ncbi:MAG: aminodeoxychorismate lyase [Alphaproteobacteria bacterium]
MAQVWLNDGLVAADTACISPADRGLLLGDGLFETLLVRDGRIAFAARHLDRLARGAATLRIPLPPRASLEQALRATVAANAPTGGAALRLTVTRGPGGRGLAVPDTTVPTLLVTCAPLAAGGEPAHLAISDYRRNETSPLSAIKSLSYLDAVLARAEALDAGCDDAVLRNAAGNLVCASAANLFAVIRGTLVTPPLSDGPLPGTVRAVVLERATIAGIAVNEATLALAALDGAEEVFLTNSLIGLRPVHSVEGQVVGASCPGPITRQLMTLYEQELDRSLS